MTFEEPYRGSIAKPPPPPTRWQRVCAKFPDDAPGDVALAFVAVVATVVVALVVVAVAFAAPVYSSTSPADGGAPCSG